jgi:hypothetical protein
MQPKDIQLHLLLSSEDRNILEKLAAFWNVTLAAAIRRAVRETWSGRGFW